MEKRILRKVVLITAAVAVASLGIAALIGFATAGFRPSQFGRTGGGTTVDEKASFPIAGVDLLAVSAVSEDVRITEDRDELWSSRKVLRRALWHERDHTQHIRQLLTNS